MQISFSAKDLKNRDVVGTSDPMLVVYERTAAGRESELGRSEVIPNTLNPKWTYQLTIDYRFEEVQLLRLAVYDVDSNYKTKTSDQFDLNKQDYLGEMQITLAEVINSPSHVLTRPLQRRNPDGLGHSRGDLSVRAEEVSEISRPEEVELAFRCTNLENREMFSKSDPILRISRVQPDGSITPVYQTEEEENNLNPIWRPFRTTLQQLCNGNKDIPLLLEVLDYNSSGKHKLIGSVKCSLNGLLELALAKACLTLTRLSQMARHHDKGRGKLFVDMCVIIPVYSFLDYVFGGCEISFYVAVDFTASNGDPRLPKSLHYIDPAGRLNAYQDAIVQVGGVLQYYDSDKMFPVWGFGGRIPPNQGVSHCFALNGNESNCEVSGIDGILAAYSQAVCSVELYGPTWFAPVIRQAASLAEKYQRQQKYFVLLIITDGAILDMDATVDAIVAASNLPLSLLIVGVGNADFSAMDLLDSDKKRLATKHGRVAVRDIVQFVSMKSVSNVESAFKSLLRELPDQLLSYMKTNRVFPNRPPA